MNTDKTRFSSVFIRVHPWPILIYLRRTYVTTRVPVLDGGGARIARGEWKAAGGDAAQRMAVGEHRRYRAHPWRAGDSGEAHTGRRTDPLACRDRARRRTDAPQPLPQATDRSQHR